MATSACFKHAGRTLPTRRTWKPSEVRLPYWNISERCILDSVGMATHARLFAEDGVLEESAKCTTAAKEHRAVQQHLTDQVNVFQCFSNENGRDKNKQKQHVTRIAQCAG